MSYDEIGNLTNDGTWAYTWEHGRQLASMTNGSKTWDYSYNADGLRTERTDGTNTYSYVYNGDQLAQMTINNGGTIRVLAFSYDALGLPVSMTVTSNGSSSVYYYVNNVQGDVVAILNSAGTEVVTYTYDAWGNILSIGGSFAAGIGVRNPLRYRGYVYDTETGLYYLQSRYYNPSWGRFINADTAAVLVVSLDSAAWDKNLYAYCDNNPICRRDVDGDFWVGAVVGGIVSGTISAFTSRKDDGSIDLGQVAIDTAFGALSGAFVGVNKPLVDGLISLTNSVVDEAYSQYKSGFQNFDIGTSLQTVATNTAKDILVGDIVSKKADEALSFVTVPRDIASQSAADYSAKASVREGLEQSSSYYRRRELRQAGISQSLNNWYCGLKSGISSFFGKLF